MAAQGVHVTSAGPVPDCGQDPMIPGQVGQCRARAVAALGARSHTEGGFPG